MADVARLRHGKWMRLAAKRYIQDRKRAADGTAPFWFSETQANNFCDLIEKLPHIEGTWETETIVLHPSHIFFIVNLFGFRNADGARRFSTALFCSARKNAKSTLAAAILLGCQCLEEELGAQIISAATTGSQARIVFNIANKMAKKTDDLREQFALDCFASSIVNYEMGSNFKPINSKASTQDGLNPSHTCLDEIHAHKDADLLNVLKSAAGARGNALWLYTTTEGYETPGPWPELRHFAHQVLNGVLEADHFLPLIFAIDDQEGEQGQPGYIPKDDDYDESKWIKANPLMEVNPILAREMSKLAIEAKQMPSMAAEFRIKRLNRQSAAAKAWLNIEFWKRCNKPVDLDFLEGKECWAGLDGASTTDLMSFRLVWRHEGIVYTYGRRWVPEGAVKSRTNRGTVPYAGWVEAGYMTMLPGEIIDYAFVEKEILALCKRFNPKKIAYDSWNIRDLVNRLKDAGLEMEEFRQGPKTYNPAMKEAERLYLGGNLRHGGDPVFNWCMSNIVPRYDGNMNCAPDKKKSPDKIDDGVAFFEAIGVMGTPAEKPPAPQLFFA